MIRPYKFFLRCMQYFFSVADIVQVLTDSVNPRDYIKKMLKRDPELKSKWGTICPPVRMMAPDGKKRNTQAANMEGVLRIIQSIPSKKAEPLKQWLAKVGGQRIDLYRLRMPMPRCCLHGRSDSVKKTANQKRQAAIRRPVQ